MGSREFDGVTFRVYPQDHAPPHVHACYQGVLVIVELDTARTVRLARRWDAVRSADAKRSHIRHVLAVADVHFDDLMRLWESAHA